MLSEDLFKIPHKRNFNSASSFSIGVPFTARCAFFPRNADEFIYLIQGLKYEKYFVVGIGSNILPPENYDGFIIFTRNIRSLKKKGDLIFSECGASFFDIINYALLYNMDCASFMTGIPSSLGGGIYMNAGTKNGYVGDIIERVEAIDGNKILSLNAKECLFLYKDSVFQKEKLIILNALLKCEHATAESIKRKISTYRSERNKLPKGKSMGCIFKNPDGQSAGRIIDLCGLKNSKIGGAYVSDIHANFILNDGTATVGDIKRLINHVKQSVFYKTEIILHEEIVYLE